MLDANSSLLLLESSTNILSSPLTLPLNVAVVPVNAPVNVPPVKGK